MNELLHGKLFDFRAVNFGLKCNSGAVAPADGQAVGATAFYDATSDKK